MESLTSNGGVESVIMNYYRNINRNNIQFDFLCNTEQVAYEDEINKLGGRIFRVTARSKNLKEYKKDMKEFFKQNAKNYDTIWVNICSLANIDYLKYAKKYGIKRRIIHCHNSQNMDSFIRGFLHKFNKIFLRNYATDFWTCSNDASRWFYSKKMMQSNKYCVIKNAIDTKKFIFNEKVRNEYRDKLNINDKFVIGNVGRFHFQKNHPFIIKIFNEIHKQKPNSVLVLVGVGPDEDKIRKLVKEYNLEDSVKFLGSRNDVPELMQAMDIFLFPSLFEGLALVAIEAQTAGLPVFASDKVIASETKIDNTIFNFIPLDENESYWAQAILKFDNNKRQRNSNEELIKESGYDIKVEALKLEEKLKSA